MEQAIEGLKFNSQQWQDISVVSVKHPDWLRFLPNLLFTGNCMFLSWDQAVSTWSSHLSSTNVKN